MHFDDKLHNFVFEETNVIENLTETFLIYFNKKWRILTITSGRDLEHQEGQSQEGRAQQWLDNIVKRGITYVMRGRVPPTHIPPNKYDKGTLDADNNPSISTNVYKFFDSK